jgi:hypothetical protein
VNQDEDRPPPRHVPTLTEVLAEPEAPAVHEGAAVEADEFMPASADAARDASSMHEQLAQRVLAGVQRHIDLALEQRLRELLAPTLARLTESLMHETREHVGSLLRELIERAVAQELERLRRR